MDATVIDLCASVFDWARFRQTKGAVKLHLLLGHDGYLPEYAVIPEGKRHEVRVAHQMRFTPGTMLVFDRGYTDYEWSRRLTRQHVHFMTRLKDNADYGVVEERELPRRKGVRRDQVIFYKQGREGKECFFRRVEFWDETQNRLLVFLTNQMTLSAATIAAVYKERWAIELFFQGAQAVTSREDLRGNSANALKTQIWAALIAMLLIKYLQLRSTFSWSLSNLVALLRQQLFVYRDLWIWIDAPFQSPPQLEFMPPQLALSLA